MTAWMRMTGEDALQLVRIRDESFGYADMNNGFLRLIVIEDDFESDFFSLADAFLAHGGTFFDVGANHGLLSFGLAARHGDKVQFHLFEPNPELVASIQKSLALYPLIQCRVNPVAISDRVGAVSFLITHEQSGTSHVTENGGELVPSITIDQYIEQADVRRVEFMKLDIEGHELAALRGARRSLESRCIQAVYFEYVEKWVMRVPPQDGLLNYLDALGFQVCFCRSADLERYGGASHTMRAGLLGSGVPLLPIMGFNLPENTDLLAIPKENLVRGCQ